MDSMNRRSRLVVWIGFTGCMLLVLGLKARQLGWLQPKAALELNGQPAVLVFVKYRYVCECEAFVNGNARAQVTNWHTETHNDVPLHLIDIELRADLARHYHVIRTPTLLLLNSDGDVVWRQDGITQSTSDGLPLDLDELMNQITKLIATSNMEKP